MTRGIRTVTKSVRRPSVQGMSLWLLAALFMGAFAACTQATDAGIPTASDSQAASPGEANSAQAATTLAAEDPQDAALTYSRCMRENGLSEFPDADAEGRIRIPLGSIDPDSAVFQEASDACRHLAPEGWGEAEVGPGDAEVMLEFARCMREHGVPDYPDPDPSAGNRITLDPNDPQAQVALESCKAILEELQSGPRIGG
jgi:hypothetical protein